MKKLLLIQPPIHPESMIFGTMDPYPLELLAAAAREACAGLEVAIVDLRMERGEEGWKKIRDYQPDIAGVTGYTIDYQGMLETLAFLKSETKDGVLTVVGGHHATMVPVDFHVPDCDVIVRGPGVEALVDLCRLEEREGLAGVRGITWQDAGGMFHDTPGPERFEELRSWPIPAYDLTRGYLRKYRFFGFNCHVVTTALGCPHRCTFCACWKAASGKYVQNTPERIVEQLRHAPGRFIFFGDDLSFGNIKHAERLAALIRKEGIRKTYLLYCRADIIVRHPELLAQWRDVGLRGAIVGMEASNDADLDAYRKKSSVEINERANEILLGLGIHNFAHLMVKPSFTKPDFMRLTDYTYRHGIVYPTYSILTPLPGTDLERESKDRLLSAEHAYYDLAHPLMDLADGDVEQFYVEMRGLYYRNYSYRRWLRAMFRRLMGFLFGKKYSAGELAAPILFLIPFVRVWVDRQLRKRTGFTEKIARQTPRPSRGERRSASA